MGQPSAGSGPLTPVPKPWGDEAGEGVASAGHAAGYRKKAQASNDASILGGLPLLIIEECRHRDNSVLHLLVVLLLEVLQKVLQNALVQVLSGQVRVSSGRRDLEVTVGERGHADKEGTTTQIVDQDVLLCLIVKAIGDRSCSGLDSGPENAQASKILGGLPLRVNEVCGRRDNSVFPLLVVLLLEVLQNTLHNTLAQVLCGQVRVTGGRRDLEDTADERGHADN
jgi:hypothetical protein